MKPVPITRCVFKQQFDDMKVFHEDHVSSGGRRPSEGAANKRGTFISVTLVLRCTFLWLISHFYGMRHSESRKPSGDMKIHPAFLYRNMYCVLHCSSTTMRKQAFLRANMYACIFVFWLSQLCTWAGREADIVTLLLHFLPFALVFLWLLQEPSVTLWSRCVAFISVPLFREVWLCVRKHVNGFLVLQPYRNAVVNLCVYVCVCVWLHACVFSLYQTTVTALTWYFWL